MGREFPLQNNRASSGLAQPLTNHFYRSSRPLAEETPAARTRGFEPWLLRGLPWPTGGPPPPCRSPSACAIFVLPMPPARGVPSARGWLRDAEWFLRGVGRVGSAAAPRGRRPHLAEMRTELLLRHIAARPEARPAILRFLEDAACARAAWETGLPVHLLDPGPDGGISIVSSPGVASLDPEATTLWMGMGPPPSWLAGATWSAQQDARARAYWLNSAFRTLAGRSVVRAEVLSQLCLELAAMAREGRRRAFVKACAFKRGTSTVPLAGVRDPRDAWRIMAAACGEETPCCPTGRGVELAGAGAPADAVGNPLLRRGRTPRRRHARATRGCGPPRPRQGPVCRPPALAGSQGRSGPGGPIRP